MQPKQDRESTKSDLFFNAEASSRLSSLGPVTGVAMLEFKKQFATMETSKIVPESKEPMESNQPMSEHLSEEKQQATSSLDALLIVDRIDEISRRRNTLKKSISIVYSHPSSSDKSASTSSSSLGSSEANAIEGKEKPIETISEIMRGQPDKAKPAAPSEEFQEDEGFRSAEVRNRKRIERVAMKKMKETDYRSMQAYRNIAEKTRRHKQATIGDRNRALKEQMQINMMLQYLRNNMEDLELAEVYADLNTEHPSKKTELLLEAAAAYIDNEKK